MKNPKSVHDFFINNILDEAKNVFYNRNDLNREKRFDLADEVSAIAHREIDQTPAAFLGRGNGKQLTAIVDKFGFEKGKAMLLGAVDKLYSVHPVVASYKEQGFDKDIIAAIKRSMSKAVDDYEKFKAKDHAEDKKKKTTK